MNQEYLKQGLLRVEKLARDQLKMRTTTPAITQYVPLPAPRASEGAR